MSNYKILVVEDDTPIAELLAYRLKKEGYDVGIAGTGAKAVQMAMSAHPDLVLLDWQLPDISGLEVCRQLNDRLQVPIIMVTARNMVEDKVLGLEAGADDYITKPFALEELMARIRCICRRPHPIQESEVLSYRDLIFHVSQSQLSCGAKKCTLSRREGELLALFLKNPDQTLPRSTILLRVWGPDSEIENGNLDNYIHFLRRRLRTVSSEATLTTVRGIGYRLS